MTDLKFVPRLAGPREWAALVVLVLVVMLLAIDGTVLYLAVPSLTEDLSPTSTEVLWIGDIYAFVLAGLLITMGNVADRIGRKRLLLMGSAAFGAASVLAAFAPSAEALIAARALLGVAGATLMPSTLSIVRSMFLDPVQRTRAIALWSVGATAGAALGPLVGGVLLENFWWGSVFLINVPIMVLALVGGWFLLPESRGTTGHRIDLASSALSILAIVPLVYAVKRWIGSGADLLVFLAAVLGLLAGWAFLRRQKRLTVPLLDVSLFRIPAFAGAVGANALAIFAFLGLLFFFSQYLQMVRGFGPLHAGLAELPATLASIAVVAVIGFLVVRLGAGRCIGAGLGLGALGLAGIGATAPFASYWGLGVSLAVLGLGIGIAMTLTTDAVVSTVPKERSGAAAAIAETGYELGGALGIAVLGSLQAAMYRSHLELPQDLGEGERAAVNESLASALATVKDSAVLTAARDAFASAMQLTSFIAAILLLVAAMIAWRVIPSTPTKKVEHDAA
ncbi:MFS transporter [Streptomyces sp. NEAU-W12]|uniref:MFS transporter n=1 Tax=Streptomyces sp. NEAU-W12 TaxID=2994668 RepID=UPI00224AEF6B|nr:MFS transporter [Streptomyces sp. NEAU-W12]MCX2928586.1 MFS transporter [Streptomyces sp. NEAU-W12]